MIDEKPEDESTEAAADAPPAEDAPVEEPAAEQEEPAAEEPAVEEEAPAEAEAPPEAAPTPEPPKPAAPPEEQLPPKELRRRRRREQGGPPRPQRDPAERAAERDSERRSKAAQRRRRRARERERTRTESPGQGTPPADHPSNLPKERQGIVVSNKSEKTITVRLEQVGRHRTYDKVIRRSATVHVHDERNEAGEGDVVRIVETRPLSRTKRWRLTEIVERAR